MTVRVSLYAKHRGWSHVAPAKGFVIICTALLLLSPVALAQQTAPTDDEQDCHPDTADERCPDESDHPTSTDDESGHDDGNETDKGSDGSGRGHGRNQTGEDPRSDRANQTDRGRPDCPGRDREACDDLGDGEHVEFDHVPGHVALRNYTVDGFRLLDGAGYSGTLEGVSFRTHGASTVINVGDDRVMIHDTPTGLIGFKGGPDGNGTFLFVFPEGSTFEEHGRSISVQIGDRHAVIVAENATRDGGHLSVHGFATVHLRPAEPQRPAHEDDEGDEDDEADPRIADAIRDRRLAARVGVPAQGAVSDAAVEAYDDVNITVSGGSGTVTRDDPLRIEVDGEFAEGRTFTADIPRDRLAGPDLEIRAFIVHEDGAQTEVLLKQADDIDDILDPLNDDGDMEYWVVHDVNGVQVLLSVGHFSSNAFTVASFGEVVSQPSVVAGIVAGVGAAIAAVAGMMWPRRRT